MKYLYFFAFLFLCHSLSAQEKFVDINGQNFHVKELGQGDITVLFENGMSDSLEIWGSIPDSVAKFGHVFLYDRADIGKSDRSRQPRTIPNQVEELRKILETAQIKPPYILVGHSLGGLINRYFVGNYPQDVKGLLLLDPAPEIFWNKMSKKELKEYIEGGTEWYHTRFQQRYWGEWEQFIPNLKYMDEFTIPDNLPVILVSASAWEWFKFHEEIIKDVSDAKHVELEGQHHIFKDHPAEIIKYIRELVDQVPSEN